MQLDFEKMGGLVPAVVQDMKTKEVLMVGFMNQEAWRQTLETSKVTFFSRTRNKLWTKGETSGNFLLVKEIFVDCDNDTLLIEAEPNGPVCHTGNVGCFFSQIR
jgi:phosphoribosyl-ATP pyrophosphohydrolase/phosphoribosyl-AMP cyclohydrolase